MWTVFLALNSKLFPAYEIGFDTTYQITTDLLAEAHDVGLGMKVKA